MTIQGIGSSNYTYASSFTSSFTSSTTSETEETTAFDTLMDATEVMEQDDANSDGVLTIDETPLSEEMFSSADADGDGELSSEELEDMLENAPPPPPPMMGETEEDSGTAQDAESIMASDDVNGDGVLTIDETPLDEEMFNAADSDGDGELSSEELQAHLDSRPPAGEGGPAGGGGTGLEEIEEYTASTTASIISDAYETASLTSFFSSSDDDSYSSLFSSLVV